MKDLLMRIFWFSTSMGFILVMMGIAMFGAFSNILWLRYVWNTVKSIFS